MADVLSHKHEHNGDEHGKDGEIGLLASGGGESPGAVGYGDVVLRVQGIVALLARLDDDVRFGFAMPDYV